MVYNWPNNRASLAPHVETNYYIGPAMDFFICHKLYIPKTRSERISYTLEFFPIKLSAENMSYIDATIHAVQYLIHALQNPARSSPLVTLRNSHNDSFRSLSIFSEKATSPERPMRVVQP